MGWGPSGLSIVSVSMGWRPELIVHHESVGGLEVGLNEETLCSGLPRVL